MLKVNNKKAVKNLSLKSLRANGMKNIIAIIAIALTTTLFTALFTVGGSIVSTMQEATMRQVGTSAHGGFKYMSEEEYDIVKQDPKVRDISYNIIIGFGENPELNKTYTEIRWTEEKDAEWSFSMPTAGRLPESGMELATTTAVLDALGVKHELGAQVPLTFTANGVTHNDTFTLCGFWEPDQVMGANEAFVSREYCDKVAPAWKTPEDNIMEESEDLSTIAGSINSSLWFATSWDIDGQIDRLVERCGFDPAYVHTGVNWAYAYSDVDPTMAFTVVLFLLIVMASGYLIIYNIFYISVSRDIRYYGLLKTIGTTGKQLKKIVRKQAMSLSALGIPAGLIIGWLTGRVLVPVVLKSTAMTDKLVMSVNPVIFVAAVLFTLLTVYISCIRPCRLAASVSPVEAVRFTGMEENGKRNRRLSNRRNTDVNYSAGGASVNTQDAASDSGSKNIHISTKKTRRVTPFSMAVSRMNRDRKKVIIVVLSLSLSMILLNGIYTMITGFDMDKYLKNQTATDFLVSDATVRNAFSSAVTLDGVTPTVLSQIQQLDGLEMMGSVYMKEASHVLTGEKLANAKNIVEKNKSELRLEYAQPAIDALNSEGSMSSHYYGVDESIYDKLEVEQGTFDAELFSTGDYVLCTAFWSDGKEPYYSPGDKVTLDFGNGDSKEYTVMATGDIPYSMGPQHGHYIDIYFTMPSGEFLKHYPEAQPLCTGFDVDSAHEEQAEEFIKNYCENVETSLDYVSRNTFKAEFRQMQQTYGIAGGVLSFVLALIGILNFINAELMSVLSRKRELAMLQSVGLTGRQLKKMLVLEGLFYAAATVIFTFTAGSLICYALVKAYSQQMWFFNYHFTVLPVAVCTPFIILIAALVPLIVYKNISRQSIVERLRETE